MTRRNPPAKWVLPGVVDPPGRKCFVINVPDEPQHIAAFRGAMLDLASAYKWSDDLAHTAREVALVWRDVIDNMEECPVPLQFRTNPFDPCGAQVSFDGGVVWIEFFNAHQCAVDTTGDSLGGKEIPGGSTPEPGQCFDLDMVVLGNSMRLIPLAIASGWTLKFTQVQGAWNDGNIGHDWVCPTGHAFFLGTCSPLVEGTDAADPIPTIPHMKIIIRLPDGTYNEIPLDGSSYVVPAGQPAGNYFLLANDSVLADNQGSVSLHLNACNFRKTVTLTYVPDNYIGEVTGPATVLEGDEFTITWTKGGGFSATGGGVSFDFFCNLTLLSVTGWTVYGSPSHAYRYPPGFSYTFYSGVPHQPDNPTNWVGANSSTTFDMHFRLNSAS